LFPASSRAAARSLLEKAHLIRRVRFPRQLVPRSIAGTNLVSLAVMLAVVTILSLWRVPEARDTVWLVFPLGALFACIVAGFALAGGALDALYRGIQDLVQALPPPRFFPPPGLDRLSQLPGVGKYPAAGLFLHWRSVAAA